MFFLVRSTPRDVISRADVGSSWSSPSILLRYSNVWYTEATHTYHPTSSFVFRSSARRLSKAKAIWRCRRYMQWEARVCSCSTIHKRIQYGWRPDTSFRWLASIRLGRVKYSLQLVRRGSKLHTLPLYSSLSRVRSWTGESRMSIRYAPSDLPLVRKLTFRWASSQWSVPYKSLSRHM